MYYEGIIMYKLLYLLRFFLGFFFLFNIISNASVTVPINLDINTTVNGAITTASEISPNSSNSSEYYTFTLTEEKNISIGLEAQFQNTLYLLDINGSVMKRISNVEYQNQKIVLFLPIGTYTIDISIVVPDEYGSFSLTLKENIIDITPIVIDTIFDDEWTSTSGISPNSLYPTNYYTFTLHERTDVLIDLEGNIPYMYLIDSNGTVIETSRLSGYNRAKIVQTLEAGSYMIDVTQSIRINHFSIYTLRFKTNTVSTTEIELNSTIEDNWSLFSGVSSRSKQYANYYTFTLDEDKDIVIGLETNLFTQKLYLLDSNMSVIAESYGTKVIVKHLLAGTYTIDATSTYGAIENYSLFFRENIISNIPIDINSSLFGALDALSGISYNGTGYSNYYTFVIDEEKEVIIDVSGTYTILYLLDENGNRDYSVSSRNNKIVKTFSAGTYTIEVTQWKREDEGFQLSIKENQMMKQEIVFGSMVSGVLTQNDGLSEDTHNFAKQYIFTLSRDTDVVFDLNTSINNGTMLLKNDSEIIRYISRRSIIYSLKAGEYTLEVTYDGIDTNLTGIFTLNIKENIIENTPILFNALTEGSWTENSGISTYGGYVNEYTFSLAEETRILIVLQSEYSKYIYLDGYSEYGYNSDDVAISKVLDAGIHTISVVLDNYWSNPYQTGNYTLLVQADIDQPLPVSQLSIQEVNPHSTEIKWQQSSDSIVGYKIYLNGIQIADIDASNTSYTIGGLSADSEYTYSIVAYNSAGKSKPVFGNIRTKKDDYAWLVPIQHMILN